MHRRRFATMAVVAPLWLALPARVRGQEEVAMATPAVNPETYDMVVTRRFEAPVDRVWRAWSDAEDVKRWWGPEGFTAPVAEIDFREGGTSLVCMRSPEGQDLCNTWTYTDIVPMERIAFVQRFADEDGNAIAPTDVGLPAEIPAEVPHVITFAALDDDTTELTVSEFGYPVEWIVEVSRAGMNDCLDKMEALVAGD